jgi:hypothetical protein
MGTLVDGWTPAPPGVVLMPGTCGGRDEDGQGCAHGAVHLLSPHQSTGLRRWLETTNDRAIIRPYDADRADALDAMEAPLFASFGFRPIVRQDLVRTESGGLNPTWSLFVSPLLAPTEKVTIHLRLVCFARP